MVDLVGSMEEVYRVSMVLVDNRNYVVTCSLRNTHRDHNDRGADVDVVEEDSSNLEHDAVVAVVVVGADSTEDC